MPVSLSESTATLTGVVTVEDAEPLAQWLRSAADASGPSDMSQPADRPQPSGLCVLMADCTHLHTAALQALLAGRPRLGSAPTDPFLARWVAPLLAEGTASDPADATEPTDPTDPDRSAT
jgi:hypothetical protein